jgi:hypothetical protein
MTPEPVKEAGRILYVMMIDTVPQTHLISSRSEPIFVAFFAELILSLGLHYSVPKDVIRRQSNPQRAFLLEPDLC